MTGLPVRRVLVVDDLPSIHDDFAKILASPAPERAALGDAEAELFGEPPRAAPPVFELAHAYQGAEALAMVESAHAAGLAYAVAFVDMRMPPGWDGVETIERLWRADPRLQVVICTAFSDHSWDDVLARLDVRERLLVLKKPFDPIEARQLAATLTAKWQSARDADEQLGRLEDAVQERTAELTLANATLHSHILERKQLEVHLLQSEKLASIGQLAAGVAHEINNPVGYVSSNFATLAGYQASLFEMLQAYERAEGTIGDAAVAAGLAGLRERIELDFLKEDIPMLMRESQEGLARVGKIVRDLKDFSHVDANPRWKPANLTQCIDSTLNVVNNEVRYKADIVREYGDLPEVSCIASEINQVIMNLVVNAAHAIGEERGRITIRTGTEGAEVWIEVSDNGCGIPPESLARIFDPFYTTKPVGKGTGLGLSLSYGIVQKHHGRIEVRTAVGAGTTFRVRLPIEQHALADEAMAAAA
jgi:two-component system NtrC family sensor kinase